MNATTKPGVLAVMDHAIAMDEAPIPNGDTPTISHDLREARATVERLADAVTAHLGFNGCAVKVPDGPGFYSERRHLAVTDARKSVENELRAALAAFRGEA